MKLTTTNKQIGQIAKKHTRLVITNEKNQNQFVETKDGSFELRVGAGKFSEVDAEKFCLLVRKIVQTAKQHQIELLAIQLSNSPFPKLKTLGDDWVVSKLAENLLLANYSFDSYKTSPKDRKSIKEVLICGGLSKSEKKAWQSAVTLANCVNEARDIANTPGDDMTPALLASAAKRLAKGSKVSVKVLDEKAIKREKLHALWAVGKGANDAPRFIIMEYWPLGRPKKNDSKKKPLVLVGKGITYDTGGLNLKPSGGMHDMHLDMSGGAAVIAAIVAAAKLNVKKNVVAIIPAAENAVSDRSMRAGDIINSHAGKTIEVVHTDAEGRLVLADGLSYANRYKPRAIVDAATLTGASLVALGQHMSAIMGNDEKLINTLCNLSKAEESGDKVWPLPLTDIYKEPLRKTRADVANIDPSFSRNAGTIEGAAFLSFFAPKCPWAHIDIAPRMESVPSDLLAKGAAGEPVRLLVKFIEKY